MRKYIFACLSIALSVISFFIPSSFLMKTNSTIAIIAFLIAIYSFFIKD